MDEATLKAAEFTEKTLNGEIIDWSYWAGLKNITPEQAAKLANRIDPLITKDSCIDLKAIPDDLHGTLQQAIDRLTQQLANKNASWTLVELADFLGENTPARMLDFLSTHPTTKKRRKRIPMTRETTVGLQLIDAMLTHYGIDYSDELKANNAWRKIVLGEYTSEYIKSIENKETKNAYVVLNDQTNSKFTKQDFSDKYRKRFE